jgi:KaiC/GvpD/RAD55 family RecA-like ATPase
LVSLAQIQEIPFKSMILLVGPLGSGKTTFCYQAVLRNIEVRPGIYVTAGSAPSRAKDLLRQKGLGEVLPHDMRANMLKYGWDLKKLEDEKKVVFINVSPVRFAPSERVDLIEVGMKEFRLVRLLEAIRQGVEEVDAKRVIVDP